MGAGAGADVGAAVLDAATVVVVVAQQRVVGRRRVVLEADVEDFEAPLHAARTTHAATTTTTP